MDTKFMRENNHVSCVMCQVSCVTSHMSSVMCHMSLTPTAISTDSPSANPPTMHNRLVCEDPKKIYLFLRGDLNTLLSKNSIF